MKMQKMISLALLGTLLINFSAYAKPSNEIIERDHEVATKMAQGISLQ